MTSRKNSSDPNQLLLSLPVAVELIRFEKNLLQMGFFGAHDTRHTNTSTRRLERWVNRNGQKIRVIAEFRGSGELGLPSTSDRDKYLAFMKIAMDQRARVGTLSNPVRFSGYQMLKELGLSFSGENYEDINRWGQRMVDTTITSEKVIYLASRKNYVNQTVHVFRSFKRSGYSGLTGSRPVEQYEVILEDWLLDNLNASYVVPEDFNAYRLLSRPTAKGIFGYLHLWFHASAGRPVEKSYAELCQLLNIPSYKHISKIRETMGKSLDELKQVGYLSNWDIQPMVTKEGLKLILFAGQELLHVLAIAQGRALAAKTGFVPTADTRQPEVLAALAERGISPAKAEELLRYEDSETILEQIEFGEYLMSRHKRSKFDNPAGFLIYLIENRIPVAPSFESSRRRRRREELSAAESEQKVHRIRLEESYEVFVRQEVEDELARRFPDRELEKQIDKIVVGKVRSDERFSHMHSVFQRQIAAQLLRQELRETMTLPTLSEWCESMPQEKLFSSPPAGGRD